MALDNASSFGAQIFDGHHAPRAREADRFLSALQTQPSGERSNFAAFLLGGVVVAGGLLAFLYYDTGTQDRDELTTGSIARPEMSRAAPQVPSIRIPLQPQQPANGTTNP